MTTCGYWWRRSCRRRRKTARPSGVAGIARYSLAGLFTLYAICQTDVFLPGGVHVRLSVVSWFQGVRLPTSRSAGRTAYTSPLGDREAKTRNPVLKTVQENTEAIHAPLSGSGIDTVFQLNPGNHFVQGSSAPGRYPVVAGQVGDGWPLFFVA